MKKTTALISAFALLALLRTEPARAVDTFLFNAAAEDGPSNPAVLQVGGDNTCELKVDSAAGSVAVVTIYSAVETNTDGTLKNPAIWFQVINPTNGDPNNHLGGLCPNFVGGVISGYNNGLITVRLRSKK